MKRSMLILLTLIILIPFKVYASGGFSVSPSTVTIYPGESKTITITSNNSVGKLNISSSNTSVVSVSDGVLFIDNPDSSKKFTITGKSIGSTNVSVVASSDYASFDEEKPLTGLTKKVKVNVIAKTTTTTKQKVTASPKPSTTATKSTTTTKKGTTTTKVTTTKNPNEPEKSTNNRLKSITVEGYNLEKIDDNNYKLSISNNVTNINISAVAEDPKSVLSNLGNHNITLGDNNIEIIVTSEAGTQNKINIKVTRKSGNTLEDLNNLLRDSSISDINIKINKNSKLTENDINNIKKNKKTVNFNYYDENNILIYIWTLDGSAIKTVKELPLSINEKGDNNIDKLSNYAKGIYLTLDSKYIPEGTKIKYYVKEQYNDNDLLNVYYYESKNKQLETISSDVKIKDGYIQFDAKKGSNYFISMSKINNTSKEESFNLYKIVSIGEFIILLFLIGYYSLKIKSLKKYNIMI